MQHLGSITYERMPSGDRIQVAPDFSWQVLHGVRIDVDVACKGQRQHSSSMRMSASHTRYRAANYVSVAHAIFTMLAYIVSAGEMHQASVWLSPSPALLSSPLPLVCTAQSNGHKSEQAIKLYQHPIRH